MAEVDFEQNGTEYSCRALKSNTVQDISGLNYEWAKSEDWSGEDISVQLRQSDDAAWVGWYAFGAGVQWCISGGNNALQLLDTAQTIVEILDTPCRCTLWKALKAPWQTEDTRLHFQQRI